MCNIDSNTIIHAGGYATDDHHSSFASTIDTVELTWLNPNYHSNESGKCHSKLPSQDSRKFDPSNQYSKSIHWSCQTKLPIGVASYSMININDNTVLLTGGI